MTSRELAQDGRGVRHATRSLKEFLHRLEARSRTLRALWPRLACLGLLVLPGIGASPVAQAGPFEFHSDFWLNLHHFLYEQALQQGKPREDLAGTEKKAWDYAVAFYRHSMTPHDLLDDPHMQSIDTELAEDETLSTLVVNGEDGAVWDMLNSVAAIYRAHWWTGQDQANRTWIAAVTPLVQHHAPLLMRQLTTVYEATWPKDPIRVDLAEYANWAGAYTYTYGWGRVHEIMSSTNAGYQGNAALEMLFHEATHGMIPADSGRLAIQIFAAAKSNGVETPNDLVHMFIFYTAGELTRRDLAAAGVSNYVPFADENRLYQQDWARWHGSIEVYWKQHIDGTLSLNDAVSKIVADARGKGAK
jgi:hypothetical protein